MPTHAPSPSTWPTHMLPTLYTAHRPALRPSTRLTHALSQPIYMAPHTHSQSVHKASTHAPSPSTQPIHVSSPLYDPYICSHLSTWPPHMLPAWSTWLHIYSLLTYMAPTHVPAHVHSPHICSYLVIQQTHAFHPSTWPTHTLSVYMAHIHDPSLSIQPTYILLLVYMAHTYVPGPST